MSNTHNSTAHHHSYRASLKKKLKELRYKLFDAPFHSNIYFTESDFKRLPYQPQENGRVANYYEGKLKSSFTQNEEDADANIDAKAADFIELRHKKFELSKTMPIIRD